MSRKQWGNGFWQGVEAGKEISFLENFFSNSLDAHWVPCNDFGSEGIEPTIKQLCRYLGDSSCISGSGSSVCGGFSGIWNGHVLCSYCFPMRESHYVMDIKKR